MRTTTDLNEFFDLIENSESDITVKSGVIYDIIGQPILKYKRVVTEDIWFEALKRRTLQVASDVCGITVEDIATERRESKYVIARWLVSYYLHRKHGYSTSIVGKVVGRDHATVLYSIKQVDKVIQNPNCYRELYYFLQRFERKILTV